jgi:metal-sulfur cluster biosynthetic enzyme
LLDGLDRHPLSGGFALGLAESPRLPSLLKRTLMPTVEQVREALVEVQDPELNLGILELGLVYDVAVAGENGEHVTVTMTLTSPMCPVGPMFKKSVEDHVLAVEGVKTAQVDITFTPPWDPKTMASDDVKVMLGIW